MDTLNIPSALPEIGVRASHSAPIIIATDGRAQSDSALVVGRLYAESANALREGDPATVIARMAHQSAATMIVAGLGRHRVPDRVFGDETALRLIRTSDVPVFAAASGLSHVPGRIADAHWQRDHPDWPTFHVQRSDGTARGRHDGGVCSRTGVTWRFGSRTTLGKRC